MAPQAVPLRRPLSGFLACFFLATWNLNGVFCQDEIKPTCDFKEKDVKFFDVRIPSTKVPSDLTTYVCQNLAIPLSLGRDFHAIGFLPLISNMKVVHHMILFGCPDKLQEYQDPHYCSSADNRCRQFLAQWSRGVQGAICNHQDAGVRFGFSSDSIKSLHLQIHWNNDDASDAMRDGSGFRVFYTRKLRRFDMGNLQTGQNDLEIPPRSAHFAQAGGCSPDCTREWLRHPIFLTRAHVHMHYAGDGGAVHIIRNGTEIEVINDASYDYDQPPAHSLAQPVQVLPGDEIRVTCYFNTRDGKRRREHTLFWGEGSDGEMCYAFISYFPYIHGFDQCVQFDNYDICTDSGLAPLGECVFEGFTRVFPGMADEVVTQCGTSTTSTARNTLCSSACQTAIKEILEHPCMQGRLGETARRAVLPQVPKWPQIKGIIEKAQYICDQV